MLPPSGGTLVGPEAGVQTDGRREGRTGPPPAPLSIRLLLHPDFLNGPVPLSRRQRDTWATVLHNSRER